MFVAIFVSLKYRVVETLSLYGLHLIFLSASTKVWLFEVVFGETVFFSITKLVAECIDILLIIIFMRYCCDLYLLFSAAAFIRAPQTRFAGCIKVHENILWSASDFTMK